MQEQIKKVLAEINEDIYEYEGEDLIADGLIDSIQLLDIVVSLEEEFEIVINVANVVQDNFKTVGAIEQLVRQYVSTGEEA